MSPTTLPEALSKSSAASENPYLAARREWNERYGSYIRQARIWQVMAFMSLGLATLSTGYALWIRQNTTYQPFVIAIDKIGMPAFAGFPERIEYADRRVIQNLLADFVGNFRTVTTDGAVLKHNVERLYGYLITGDPATNKLTSYFRTEGQDPFVRALTETVSVQVRSIVPLSETSYQIDWIEIVRKPSGDEKTRIAMRGVAQVQIVPPQSEAVIRVNPIGLYVKDFDWTQQF
jgi:type IV secretory pathway TrbF-like protein